jgi:hypothetical protein
MLDLSIDNTYHTEDARNGFSAGAAANQALVRGEEPRDGDPGIHTEYVGR